MIAAAACVVLFSSGLLRWAWVCDERFGRPDELERAAFCAGVLAGCGVGIAVTMAAS